jgi:hypothetical protein
MPHAAGLLQQYYHAKLRELCDVVQQLQEKQEEEGEEGPSDSGACCTVQQAPRLPHFTGRWSALTLPCLLLGCAIADAMSEDADEQQQRPPSRTDRCVGQKRHCSARQLLPHACPSLPWCCRHLHRSAGGGQAGEFDPLPELGAEWAAELSGVAGCLEQLGLAAASEEAYTRVINRCGRQAAPVCVRDMLLTSGGGGVAVGACRLSLGLAHSPQQPTCVCCFAVRVVALQLCAGAPAAPGHARV